MESQEPKTPDMTFVAVGDMNTGKTAMILKYTHRSLPETYTPTVLDNYLAEIEIKSLPITIELCDIGGAQRHQKLRILSYAKAKVFLLCFSLVNPGSFLSVRNNWHREIKSHSPNTPIILVGTNKDLVDNQEVREKLSRTNESVVTDEEAKKLADELGYQGYLPCSSITGEGIRRVFDEAIKLAIYDKIHATGKKKEKCIIW
ncbi:unnamed protein product [Blepharisma stoltei]|uniref:Uncharacterized protein n=1 Tax=Blepharisma stoltei TaxID=1481888 RepID=A0AAU9JCY8_9CILI|nr:unnamed protein product [Blepharisma stoltei]